VIAEMVVGFWSVYRMKETNALFVSRMITTNTPSMASLKRAMSLKRMPLSSWTLPEWVAKLMNIEE
jgi:hypothetical protein